MALTPPVWITVRKDPFCLRGGRHATGKTVIGAEVGKEYGITDIDGKFPPSVRDGTGASPPQYFPYKVKMG